VTKKAPVYRRPTGSKWTDVSDFLFRVFEALLRLGAWWLFRWVHAQIEDGTMLAIFPPEGKTYQVLHAATVLVFAAVYVVLLIEVFWCFVRAHVQADDKVS